MLKMSLVLEDYKKRILDWKIKFNSEPPFSYVRRHIDLLNEILFCVEIPWPLLRLSRQFTVLFIFKFLFSSKRLSTEHKL